MVVPVKPLRTCNKSEDGSTCERSAAELVGARGCRREARASLVGPWGAGTPPETRSEMASAPVAEVSSSPLEVHQILL